MLNKSSRILGVIAVAVATMLGGCATAQTSTIEESDGRLMLADSFIGEAYDGVIARAVANYKVEPQCENRKVGLKNSRKAFFYDICGFNPKSAQFAKAPLSEVVYHFIDQSLVRVDVRAQGENTLLNQVKEDMQQVFATRETQASELGNDSYQWVTTERVGGVRSGGGVNAGNIHVRLYDQSLIDSAPWLAIE